MCVCVTVQMPCVDKIHIHYACCAGKAWRTWQKKLSKPFVFIDTFFVLRMSGHRTNGAGSCKCVRPQRHSRDNNSLLFIPPIHTSTAMQPYKLCVCVSVSIRTFFFFFKLLWILRNGSASMFPLSLLNVSRITTHYIWVEWLRCMWYRCLRWFVCGMEQWPHTTWI